ncbi:MAG: hypothetical protein PHI48_08690 [Bacteroidales bacterium]|nr:hypothetical protein [Bacteroidales bacterium]
MNETNEANESVEVIQLVEKYERALAQNITPYFDIEEIDTLLDYYDEDENSSIDDLIKIVDLGLQLHPDDPEFKVQKIELLSRADRHEEAKALLSQADFDPFDTLLVNIIIYTEKKEFGALYDLFLTEKVSLSEEQWEYAWQHLCMKLFDMEEYQEGLICLNKFSDKAPEDESDHITRLRTNLLIRTDQYKEAVKFANIIIDRKPYEENSWLTLASIYANLGNYPKMKDALEYAHAISPDDPKITFMLATCLETLDLNKEATELLESFEGMNILKKYSSQWEEEPGKNKMELSAMLTLFDHLCGEKVHESMLPLFYAMKEEYISEELMILINERIDRDPMNGNLYFIKSLIFMTENRTNEAINAFDFYPMSETGINDFDDYVFTAVMHYLSGNRSGAVNSIAECAQTMGIETFSTIMKQLSPLIEMNNYIYSLFVFYFWNNDELADSVDEFITTLVIENKKIYPKELLIDALKDLHYKLIQLHRAN